MGAIRTAFAFLAVYFALGASAARAQPTVIGPIVEVQQVEGISITVPIRVEVSQGPSDLGTRIRVRVVADLSDLAAKTGDIVDCIPLPKDNCASYSANNPVVTLGRKSLVFRDDAAILSVGGSVDMWECAENPIPKTKVEMQVKDIGLGVKTKVPVVVNLGPGDPIKTKLGTQPFDVDLPVTLSVEDGRAVALRIGRPAIRLRGPYVSVTEGVLSIAGVDVNERAQALLERAIDPDKLCRTVPTFAGFAPTVEGAGFIEDGGRPAAEIVLAADLSVATAIGVLPKFFGLLAAEK